MIRSSALMSGLVFLAAGLYNLIWSVMLEKHRVDDRASASQGFRIWNTEMLKRSNYDAQGRRKLARLYCGMVVQVLAGLVWAVTST